MARFERLRKRREFIAAASGARYHAHAFSLQVVPRDGKPLGDGPARFGFTVTKKTGKAVERNRIRRRLREAVRKVADVDARPGFDYVLIARRQALALDFIELTSDLRKLLRRAHATRQGSDGRTSRQDGSLSGNKPAMTGKVDGDERR